MLVVVAVALVSTAWLLLIRRRAHLTRTRSRERALEALGTVVRRIQNDE